MRARRLLPLALFVLNGCMFSEPFTAPELVAGSETSVSVRSGHLRGADAFAQRYCAKYGRRAVVQSRGQMNQKAVTFHLYECVQVDAR